MDADRTPMTDPESLLERSLIDEFLQAHGTSIGALHSLPAAQAEALLKEASRYASSRLTEVESRARFVNSIKGDVDLTG